MTQYSPEAYAAHEVSPPVRIEDWTITEVIPGYRRLFGTMYGHPAVLDGNRGSSSYIDRISDTEARTISGTVYQLGRPKDTAVQVWQQDHGYPNSVAEAVIR